MMPRQKVKKTTKRAHKCDVRAGRCFPAGWLYNVYELYEHCSLSTSRVFWCDALNTPTRASLLPQRLNMCKQAARHTSTFSQPLHSQNMGPEDFTLQKYFEQHVLTTKHHDV